MHCAEVDLLQPAAMRPCPVYFEHLLFQLHNIFIQFGENIQTARQLRNAVFAKFFDKS